MPAMPGQTTTSLGPFGHAPRSTRAAILAVLVCMAALILWTPAPARAALPPQGVYEQCAPATQDCGARLQAIADAGFQYVLNYTAWYGSAEQVRQYADEAQAAGIKVIWPLNDHAWRDGTDLRSYYRYLGPDCPCSTNAQFKQWALGLVKDHPATWGFYVGDELSPTSQNISQTKALAQRGEVDRTEQADALRDDPQRQRGAHQPARALRADGRLRGRRLLPRRKGRTAWTRSPDYAEDTRRLAAQYGQAAGLRPPGLLLVRVRPLVRGPLPDPRRDADDAGHGDLGR